MALQQSQTASLSAGNQERAALSQCFPLHAWLLRENLDVVLEVKHRLPDPPLMISSYHLHMNRQYPYKDPGSSSISYCQLNYKVTIELLVYTRENVSGVIRHKANSWKRINERMTS